MLIVKEDAVAGLYDYFNDIMDLKHISYRLDRNDWLPIEEVMDLLDFQWIANVIEGELSQFSYVAHCNCPRRSLYSRNACTLS